MSKITKKESLKLKKKLPLDYCKTIAKKINDAGKKISERYVLKIISAEAVDNYGVIEIATDMAIEEKIKKQKLSQKINQL